MNKYKGILANSGAFTKTLVLAGSFLFFGILGILLWKLIPSTDPTTISSTKILHAFTQIGAFAIPSILLAFLASKNPSKYLHLDQKPKLIPILGIVLFMIVIIPFVNFMGFINEQLIFPESLKWLENSLKASELQAAKATEQLLKVNEIGGLIANIFVIALLPALSEELFFRGALQQVFSEKKKFIAAIWLTAFVFSSIHFQFYGFIPRLVMGAFFGYLVFWSKNIWLPIVGHFTNNLLTVVFYYLINTGHKLPAIDKIGTGSTLWIGIASCAMCIVGFFQLKKIIISKEQFNY